LFNKKTPLFLEYPLQYNLINTYELGKWKYYSSVYVTKLWIHNLWLSQKIKYSYSIHTIGKIIYLLSSSIKNSLFYSLS